MKKRILIVDDDLSATRLLRLALERTGQYEVREENRGLHARAAAEAFRPDLLLLDVCMPDLDGGEVAFQLKADPRFRRLPIMFFTSIVSERDAEAGTPFLSGGFRFLPKTVSNEMLVACIEEELGEATPASRGAG
jgi:two-component system OmpR family response regulator